MRRFASPDKGFAKQRPGLAKCGGVKPHKGRKPDCGFTEPEPPLGGEARTGLLCEVGFVFTLSY
jgi:hypothetical protein